MKKLGVVALLAAGAMFSTSATAAKYTVFPSLSACKSAAKIARLSGEPVSDCRLVDGGWTYTPETCQDDQCGSD